MMRYISSKAMLAGIHEILPSTCIIGDITRCFYSNPVLAKAPWYMQRVPTVSFTRKNDFLLS